MQVNNNIYKQLIFYGYLYIKKSIHKNQGGDNHLHYPPKNHH